MLRRLANGAASIGDLGAPFDMTFAAASKHVKVLERARLVRREVRGRTHLCSLDPEPLHAGMEWIRFYERFWSERLDILEDLIRAETETATDDDKESKS